MQLGSILITGGSGFFSRAFVRHLLDNNLSDRICIYSRCEFKQAQMRDSFNDDKRLRFFIGDVRSRERLTRACAGVDVVIHAAALKRVDACEYNIMEAVATNIMGTENVVNACIDTNIGKAVFLNTDKSVNPSTIYGFTKAMAEKVWLGGNHYSGANGTKFVQTLYGNVAGSTGSIIPKWKEMVANGATKVPVTDPEMTRFYMTEEEAVKLVLLAISDFGQDTYIPRLPAYKVGDLAEAMGVEMNIIGAVDGEKVHEEMRPGEHSGLARRMTIEELKDAL